MKQVQINLDVSPEVYEAVKDLAQKVNGENAEVFFKTLALLQVAAKHYENPNLESETDLSKIIPLVISIAKSPEDAELERKLRELRARQELRKDWILFIVKDVVIFPAAIAFILALTGYFMFTIIHR